MIWQAMQSFIAQGGPLMWVLFTVSVGLWLLITERYLFIYRDYPNHYQHTVQQWQQRNDYHSWAANSIRQAMLSENKAQLLLTLPMIKMLIALCPLLGLLGTVTGMIGVFDTIAITGTNDAKAMASGIYRATLPTMAGLFLALSALYFHHHLRQKTQQHMHQLEHVLSSASCQSGRSL